MFSEKFSNPRSRIYRLLGPAVALSGIVVSGIALFAFLQSEAESRSQQIVSQTRSQQAFLRGTMENELRSVIRDLRYLTLEVESIYNANGSYMDIETDFKHLAQSKKSYDQIRILNFQGHETLRVNWSPETGPQRVDYSQLGNKASRYYFSDTLDLERGEVYISRLDLNEEDGNVELPLKPMLRFASPLIDDSGHAWGVVVVNYLASELLKFAEQTDMMFVDSSGDFLVGEDKSHLWSKQLGHWHTFPVFFTEEWESIKSQKSSQVETKHGLFVIEEVSALELNDSEKIAYASSEPTWFLIRRYADPAHATGVDRLQLQLLGIYILCCAISIIGGLTLQKTAQTRFRAFQEMEKAKVAAEQAAHSKSEFLATMSHEIRTPMNGVIAMAEALELTNLDADQRRNLEIIRTSGDVLLQVINDILDLAKMDAGKLLVEQVSFNLRSSAKNAIDLFQKKADEKDIDLKLSFAEGLPENVVSDPVRVRQILFNLINNAVKFTEKQGTVILSVYTVSEPSGDSLRFVVEDTGIGMSPEQVSNLFTPFSQADQSITRRFGGTGLGLTICRKILDIMEGTIHVSSEAGKGSRFTVKLQLELPKENKEQARTTAPTTTPASYRSLDGGILIVDDSKINREILTRMLQTFGIDSKSVDGGKSALELLENEEFSLILMDLQMPEMDGFETTRRIHERYKGGDAPVIVACTANVLPEDQQKAKDVGMAAFLGKPLRREHLEQVLRMHDAYTRLDAPVLIGTESL
ncbi:MAG: ATP-binding protein [Opitutales bacterium]